MKRFFASLKETDVRNVVAVLTSNWSFLIVVLLISRAIPKDNHDIVIAAVGYVLGQANGNVYGYLFNSTKSDKKKDDQIT